MNMFKKTAADSLESYLKAMPEDRRKIAQFLHGHLKKTVPSLKPFFATNMIGYGKFKYRNYRKEIVDWPVIALANQKQYLSLYVCSVRDGKYAAEQLKENLGKVQVGRSCIRFKKLEDLHLPTLTRLLKFAAKNPGLGQEKA